jgi:hypothetical protein
MPKTGVSIELSQLIVDGAIAEDAAAQVQRLSKAGVVVVLVSALPQMQAELLLREHIAANLPPVPVYGLPVDDAGRWRWPKPAMLLRAAKEQDIDIFNSWIIGNTFDLFVAASQAGYLGGVYVGEQLPTEKPGLQVFNQAHSVGDAPRVMIPPKGGCWHDH